MKKVVRNYWLLLLVLLAAFFIRIVGCRPGLQQGFYPDEVMSYSSAVEMIINEDFNPRRYDYPSGTALLHLLIFRIVFFPLALLRLFFPHPRVFLTALRIGSRFLEEFRVSIFGWREIEALYWSRYITAFLGTASVFLTYLLGKKLFGKTTGLLAALFLAFNYRHVLSSHFGLADIPNAFFGILALYSALLVWEKDSRKRYLLAGLTVAFSFSIKYQIFGFLPFLVAHGLVAARERSLKKLFNPDFILAAVLVPLVFVILNPYLMTHLKEALPVIRYVAGRYGMGFRRFNFYPLFYLFRWGVGEWVSGLALLGLVLSLIFAPLKSLILLSFVAPFFFIFVYYCLGGGYVRNFVAVIPELMILGAFGLVGVFKIVQRFLKIPRAFLLMVLVFLSFWATLAPLKNSLILDYFYRQPSNSAVFAAWLMASLPSNVQLRAYPLYLPGYDQLTRKVNIVDWNRDNQNSLAEFREAGDDFVAVNVTFNMNFMYWWFNLSPRIMTRYSGMPLEILANSFEGLMVREFFPYMVAEVYKPWQAAEEANYLLAKILPLPPKLGKPVASFTFNSADDNWSIKGNFDQAIAGFAWSSEEGRRNPGSLMIQGGKGDFLTTRFVSPPIPVQSGKYYTVTGWVKNSQALEKKGRSSFLRLDFYRSLNDAQAGKIGDQVALSSRSWEANWTEKKVGAPTPEEAKFLVISFQRSDSAGGISSYLDEVTLFESEVLPEEKFPQVPYVKSQIPDEVLYPNSIL